MDFIFECDEFFFSRFDAQKHMKKGNKIKAKHIICVLCLLAVSNENKYFVFCSDIYLIQ